MRRHCLHPGHAGGLTAAKANGSHKLPAHTKYSKEGREGAPQGAAAAVKQWRPGEKLGFVPKLQQQNPELARCLTIASMRGLGKRKRAARDRVLSYHSELATALESELQESLIKAAGAFKEATALFASTAALTPVTLEQAWKD